MKHQNYFTYISLARAGSSWLHAYFKNHTTAQMPTIKEFHWFDYPIRPTPSPKTLQAQEKWAALQRRFAQEGRNPKARHLEMRDRAAMCSDQDYRDFFTSRFDPDAVFGDMTPAYGRLDHTGYKRILSVFPTAKFIFLIRNPAENMWSRAAHSRHPAAVNLTLEERVVLKLENIKGDQGVPFSPDIYENACKYVNPAQIYTQFTEYLFSEQADQTLQDLCGFLGIKGGPAAAHNYSKNRGCYHKMPNATRGKIVRTMAKSYLWAERTLPNLPENWRSDIETYL